MFDSFIFWRLLSISPMFLHFFDKSGKMLNQKELSKKSSRFREIDKNYSQASLLFVAFVLLLISIWVIGLDEWSKLKFGAPFYLFITIGAAGYEIFQAIFAKNMGVYPMGKMLSYLYADEDKIDKIAKRQIYICMAVVVLSVILFLIVFV